MAHAWSEKTPSIVGLAMTFEKKVANLQQIWPIEWLEASWSRIAHFEIRISAGGSLSNLQMELLGPRTREDRSALPHKGPHSQPEGPPKPPQTHHGNRFGTEGLKWSGKHATWASSSNFKGVFFKRIQGGSKQFQGSRVSFWSASSNFGLLL